MFGAIGGAVKRTASAFSNEVGVRRILRVGSGIVDVDVGIGVDAGVFVRGRRHGAGGDGSCEAVDDETGGWSRGWE